ncbi:hypothetical protein AGMMS49992_18480 [Clostridia bacterium]|nr:hypothetical protein AGMMS49992_18480 [Clostridia bacterium]
MGVVVGVSVGVGFGVNVGVDVGVGTAVGLGVNSAVIAGLGLADGLGEGLGVIPTHDRIGSGLSNANPLNSSIIMIVTNIFRQTCLRRRCRILPFYLHAVITFVSICALPHKYS